ncbi:ABC transporter permease DevC [Brunnivagina elsteri]|uniref:ABC transporter n=1 Tax=Brunnivagina elsteri CCALA 953 TaxID=987040 RepID=A0A2A2TFR3_9CYAN|nr:ABC transporter permease DevC [Calothrix elsteri]PAX52584.1 ABC transporter [Calothrix elsteri CCALA 953]
MLRKFIFKIPLAWQQLMKERTRLGVALAGIAFANILMFAQLGFEGALFDSAIAPHKILDTDLVLVARDFETIYSIKNLSKDRLYQARGFSGVESVSPVYIGLGKWSNPETKGLQTFLILGTDPANKIFKTTEINSNLNQLQILNQILFDKAALPKVSYVTSLFHQQAKPETEVNDKKVRIAGYFTLGKSFATYGNIITSDSTYLRLFPSHQPNLIGAGLIKVNSNANLKQVAQNLRLSLSDDIRVLTLAEYISLERGYWSKTTPIGFIFGIGVLVSFIVGSVIVYQILYSDISAHLSEYAMLKAIGYSNNYLLVVLAQEALFLALLGYFPGFILAMGFYKLAADTTKLPVYMTTERGISIFFLTLIMCFVSGIIAMGKLRSADPADLM